MKTCRSETATETAIGGHPGRWLRRVSLDESETLRALTAHRAVMDKLIVERGGRVANNGRAGPTADRALLRPGWLHRAPLQRVSA